MIVTQKKAVIFILSALLGSGAKAAEQTVVVIDMNKAVMSTTAGKKANDSLEKEYNKRKENLDKKKADIEKMGQDLEKKKALLSEEVFGKKEMELKEEMMKFQKIVNENQGEMQKKNKELLDPILEKMRKVIDKMSAEKNYSLVLERTPQNVLYVKKDFDITEEVVKAFEKEK